MEEFLLISVINTNTRVDDVEGNLGWDNLDREANPAPARGEFNCITQKVNQGLAQTQFIGCDHKAGERRQFAVQLNPFFLSCLAEKGQTNIAEVGNIDFGGVQL